jgi:hypothetical protein
MLPSMANAQTTAAKRLVFIHIPLGYVPNDYNQYGNRVEPTYLRDVFGDLRQHMSIATGLYNQPANNDFAPGNAHMNCWNAYMAGQSARTPAVVAKSFDQYAADLHKGSRLDTLSVNADFINSPYNFNSIQANYPSFRGPDLPVAMYTKPIDVFNLLFKDLTPPTTPPDTSVSDRRKAILDLVLADVKSISAQLGAVDKIRLDEYLTGIEQLKKSIVSPANQPTPSQVCKSPVESAIADSTIYPKRIANFYDLLYYSLACDLTRVASYMHSFEGTGLFHNSFLQGLQNSGWHTISHYTTPGYQEFEGAPPNSSDVTRNVADLRQIGAWHYGQTATFIRRLRDTQLPNGTTLLDETLVVIGSSVGRPDSHSFNDLIVWTAGAAGGSFKKNISYVGQNATPLANMWLTIMKAFGSTEQRIGNSTGTINQFLA